MKTFFTGIVVLLYFSVLSQAEDTIVVNAHYPFAISSSQKVPHLSNGAYLFKHDFDYIRFLNADMQNPIFLPVFFKNEEMGLLIQVENHSIGVAGQVSSVIETSDQIIVTLNIQTSPGVLLPAITSQQLFISLKRSDKTVVFRETENGQINHICIVKPY